MSFLKNLGSKPLDQTESPPMNQAAKELEETKAYLNAVAKKIKKSVKTCKNLQEGCQALGTGLSQWSSSIIAHDSESRLGTCLETCATFQVYFGDLLSTLGSSVDMKVVEAMVDFEKEEIPVAQSTKKKWDSARRDYDSAITKVIMLQKEKKPNPPKIALAESEREKSKIAYLGRGEEAYCGLLDMNEASEFGTLEKLLTWMEAFYQFCRGGYNWLRDFHDNKLLAYRQWIAEEKVRYEARRKKRPYGEWIPDSVNSSSVSGGMGGAGSGSGAHGSSAASSSLNSPSLGLSPSSKRMFGISYSSLVERDNVPAGSIPVFLQNVIDHLGRTCLGVQGIFRMSPPKSLLDELKKKIDSGVTIDWNTVEEVHASSGLLKLFLRELPQPLLTFELYTKFLEVISLDDGHKQKKKALTLDAKKPKMKSLDQDDTDDDDDEDDEDSNKDDDEDSDSRKKKKTTPSSTTSSSSTLPTNVNSSAIIAKLKSVVHELPEPNLVLLKKILNLMCLIEKNSQTNKMTASNLAVVLCPSLLYPEVPNPATMVEDIQNANRVMAFMITYFTDIFGQSVEAVPDKVESPASSLGTKTPLSSSIPKNLSNPGLSLSSSQTLLSKSSSSSALNTTSLSQDQIPVSTIPVTTGGPIHAILNSSSSQSLASTQPSITTNIKATTSSNTLNTAAPSATPAQVQHTTNVQTAQPAAPSSAPSTLQTSSIGTLTTYTPSGIVLFTAPVPSGPPEKRMEVSAMRSILKEKHIEDTHVYFLTLQELIDSSRDWTSVLLTSKTLQEILKSSSSASSTNLSNQSNTTNGGFPFPIPDIQVLRTGFKSLAVSVKNILQNVREFIDKLPVEQKNKLLLCAKDLQDHVLTMATAFKTLNDNPSICNSSIHENNNTNANLDFSSWVRLLDTTRGFVNSSYVMCSRLKEYALVDELLVASGSLSACIQAVPKSFEDRAQVVNAIAVAANALQSSTYRLTALLRSKIIDLTDNSQVAIQLGQAISQINSSHSLTASSSQPTNNSANITSNIYYNQIAKAIETVEANASVVCTSIKNMLFDSTLPVESLQLSSDMKMKLDQMEREVESIEKLANLLVLPQPSSTTDPLQPSNQIIHFATAALPVYQIYLNSSLSSLNQTLDQLNSNIQTHANNKNQQMMQLISLFKYLKSLLEQLKQNFQDVNQKLLTPTMTGSNTSTKYIAEWTNITSAIHGVLTAMAGQVQQVQTLALAQREEDPTKAQTLSRFAKSIQACQLQCALMASVEIWQIPLNSDNISKYTSLVKDLVFVSFPILFTIQDTLQQVTE